MAAVAEQVRSLSDYQRECADSNAIKTPKTYKQGPVVRLDQDVREAQKWAGVNLDGKGAASMNRDTRTALRDKIEEYQRQNGIEAKTPGELNKDTLEKMRQDKSLPTGLTDSLQKVNPYYKPEGIPRITCVVPGGGDKPAAPTDSVAPVKPAEPRTPQSLGLMDVDLPPERQAALQAQMVDRVSRMVQKREGLPETGRMDESTISAMKDKPDYQVISARVGQWKEAGLLTRDGQWDKGADVQMRKEAWKLNADKPDPNAHLFADMTDAQPKTSANTYMPEGKLGFEGSAQSAFGMAKDNTDSQSLEVQARTPKVDAPAEPDSKVTNTVSRNQLAP